jgi:long-chain acyl-CoA synthetase
MSVRQILDVQDEKQSNGKIFKKYLLGEYQFRTYEQACQQIEQIRKGLLSLNLKKDYPILIYSETRPEWLLFVMV